MSEQQGFFQRKPLRRALYHWLERHQHPFNRGIHLIGIPLALAGVVLVIVWWEEWYWGVLAFIGQPENYIYSGALWIKILALMLLGVNAGAFYLTGIFDRVNPLQAGEDAPFSAKLIAFSSLFLWFTMITFGRYIQPLSNTVRLPGAAGPN